MHRLSYLFVIRFLTSQIRQRNVHYYSRLRGLCRYAVWSRIKVVPNLCPKFMSFFRLADLMPQQRWTNRMATTVTSIPSERFLFIQINFQDLLM